jgi:hypothetical protein
MDVSMLSLPPAARLWQELQLKMPLADRRGSNHSMRPSSDFSRVIGLPGLRAPLTGSAERFDGRLTQPVPTPAAHRRGGGCRRPLMYGRSSS